MKTRFDGGFLRAVFFCFLMSRFQDGTVAQTTFHPRPERLQSGACLSTAERLSTVIVLVGVKNAEWCEQVQILKLIRQWRASPCQPIQQCSQFMGPVKRGTQIGQQGLQHLLRRLLAVETNDLVAHHVGIHDGIEQGLVLSSLAQK